MRHTHAHARTQTVPKRQHAQTRTRFDRSTAPGEKCSTHTHAHTDTAAAEHAQNGKALALSPATRLVRVHAKRTRLVLERARVVRALCRQRAPLF